MKKLNTSIVFFAVIALGAMVGLTVYYLDESYTYLQGGPPGSTGAGTVAFTIDTSGYAMGQSKVHRLIFPNDLLMKDQLDTILRRMQNIDKDIEIRHELWEILEKQNVAIDRIKYIGGPAAKEEKPVGGIITYIILAGVDDWGKAKSFDMAVNKAHQIAKETKFLLSGKPEYVRSNGSSFSDPAELEVAVAAGTAMKVAPVWAPDGL